MLPVSICLKILPHIQFKVAFGSVSPVLWTVFCFTSGWIKLTQKHPLPSNLWPPSKLSAIAAIRISRSAVLHHWEQPTPIFELNSLLPIMSSVLSELFHCSGGGHRQPLGQDAFAGPLYLLLTGLPFNLDNMAREGVGHFFCELTAWTNQVSLESAKPVLWPYLLPWYAETSQDDWVKPRTLGEATLVMGGTWTRHFLDLHGLGSACADSHLRDFLEPLPRWGGETHHENGWALWQISTSWLVPQAGLGKDLLRKLILKHD